MANLIFILSLITLTNGQAGIYDLLQGYQPFIPAYSKITDFMLQPQNIEAITNEQIQRNRDQTSSMSLDLNSRIDDLMKRTTQLHSINFFTSKPNVKREQNTYVGSDSDIGYSKENSRLGSQQSTKLNSNNNKHWASDANEQDFESRPKFTTTKSNFVTTRPKTSIRPDSVTREHASTESNFFDNRPRFTPSLVNPNSDLPRGTKSDFGTPRPFQSASVRRPTVSYDRDVTKPYNEAKNTRNNVESYNSNTRNTPTIDVSYYTPPSTIRPGVKPANVDTNQPPITNRPPGEDFIIDTPVKNREEVTNPDIIMGPDEEKMSSAEKRRYEEMVEKLCYTFKSFNVEKVQAIPLVPSPKPVQVNVSVCLPSKIPLVVGGSIATIQDFPHMALLGWNNLKGDGYSWKCGGSLISERYVLTASHCTYQDADDTVVEGAPRVVQLGSSYMDDKKALLVGVQTAIRHPKYIRTRSYYDVALLRLNQDVNYSEVIRPACLGSPPGTDESIIATGWGVTTTSGNQSTVLRSVSVPIWNLEECRQVIGTSRKMPVGPSADSQICAGDRRGGKDTCQGDSGGPAQIKDGCTWRVVAVTSLGRSCGAPNTPAIYATVHKAFIGATLFGDIRSHNNENSQSANRNRNNSGSANRNNNNNSDINSYHDTKSHNNENSQNANKNSYNNESGNRNNNNRSGENSISNTSRDTSKQHTHESNSNIHGSENSRNNYKGAVNKDENDSLDPSSNSHFDNGNRNNNHNYYTNNGETNENSYNDRPRVSFVTSRDDHSRNTNNNYNIDVNNDKSNLFNSYNPPSDSNDRHY